MAQASCICHPARDHFVVIRNWAVEFCQGNHCAAALLDFFRWHYDGALTRQQSGDCQSLLLHFTLEQLGKGLIGLYSRDAIIGARKVLTRLGVTVESQDSGFDRRITFDFRPETVNAWLDKRYPSKTADAQQSETVAYHRRKIDDGASENRRSHRRKTDDLPYKLKDKDKNPVDRSGERAAPQALPPLKPKPQKAVSEPRFTPEAVARIDACLNAKLTEGSNPLDAEMLLGKCQEAGGERWSSECVGLLCDYIAGARFPKKVRNQVAWLMETLPKNFNGNLHAARKLSGNVRPERNDNSAAEGNDEVSRLALELFSDEVLLARHDPKKLQELHDEIKSELVGKKLQCTKTWTPEVWETTIRARTASRLRVESCHYDGNFRVENGNESRRTTTAAA